MEFERPVPQSMQTDVQIYIKTFHGNNRIPQKPLFGGGRPCKHPLRYLLLSASYPSLAPVRDRLDRLCFPGQGVPYD